MNIALIMAAGSGTRVGANMPKQFLEINGYPLLWYTVKTFEESKDVDAIFIVCNKQHRDETDLISAEFTKVIGLIDGGETRQESVFNGINYLLKNGMHGEDIVLIHDAARPMVTESIIKNNIEACLNYGAVVTSIPVSDSIVRSLDKETITNSEDRNVMYLNQTPQTFKLSVLFNAYNNVRDDLRNYTDDCQIVSKNGQKIHLVNGSKLNFKVTNDEDLKLFEIIEKQK